MTARRFESHVEPTVDDLVDTIVAAHVQREQLIRSRNMLVNRRASLVRFSLGFQTSLPEAERKKLREAADELIAAVLKAAGKSLDVKKAVQADPKMGAIIVGMELGIRPLELPMVTHTRTMEAAAKQLPVAKWVQSAKGFGLINLARLLGETGNLSGYASPSKVWKRMGLAVLKGKAGSTWMRQGGLSAEEWKQFGYVPRRHAIAYSLADCLMKGNKGGPYRQRYDEAKAAAAVLHPDWKKYRLHAHALTCCVKRAIRDLWVAWNPELAKQSERAA